MNYSEHLHFILETFKKRISSYANEFAEVFGILYIIDFQIVEKIGSSSISAETPLCPNAAVSYDEKSSDSIRKTFQIHFTESLVKEIYRIFDIILNSDKTLPHIGKPYDLEKPSQKIIRADYSKYLIALTLEFVFYHEFCHICFGHLHKLFIEHQQQALYAVRGMNTEQANQISRIIKLYELDADVNALVFLVNQFKNHSPSLSSDSYRPDIATDFFFSLGLALTIFFRMIENWRQEEDPFYSSRYTDHPHPDVRDSIITAYIRMNASHDQEENEAFHQAYDRGREEAINIIADLDYFIPTFEATVEFGHREAMKELSWLPDQLNALRNEGVGELDLRVLYRNLKGNL